jgi:hypothetical protein
MQFNYFADSQRRRAETTESILRGIAAEIAAVKDSLYEIFASDGAEVQQQWLLFTERLDEEVQLSSLSHFIASLHETISGAAGFNAAQPIRELHTCALHVQKIICYRPCR